MSDRFGVKFNPFAPLPETQNERGIPSFQNPDGSFGLAPDPAYALAQAGVLPDGPTTIFDPAYLGQYLMQTPIRDAMAAGSQAFIDAPGSSLDAMRAGVGSAWDYLRNTYPEYLRYVGPGLSMIPPEERPGQPGFADIFAQGRDPLPEGITHDEFYQDVQDLLSMRGRLPGDSGGRAGISAMGFASKYGLDPELSPEEMADQATMRYGDTAVPGAIADAASMAIDVFDMAVRGLGLAGLATDTIRALTRDEALAIAAPGSWLRPARGARAGTPQEAVQYYQDVVRRYETLGPSGSLETLASDIEEMFRRTGANVNIEWLVGAGRRPSHGSVAVGDARLTFSFSTALDGQPYLKIGTLHTSAPNGRSPHQLAAMMPVLELADLNGIPMMTNASPFDHRAVPRAGLENIYNKLGFEYASGPGYGEPGSTLIRRPVTMESTELRAAEYASRRNPVIETEAMLANRPPANADEVRAAIEMMEQAPRGARSAAGELPTPGNIARLSDADRRSGLVDDYVASTYALLGDAIRVSDGRYTHEGLSPLDFTEVMNSIGDSVKAYFRANTQNPDILMLVDNLVDDRVAASIGNGRLYDRFMPPPSRLGARPSGLPDPNDINAMDNALFGPGTPPAQAPLEPPLVPRSLEPYNVVAPQPGSVPPLTSRNGVEYAAYTFPDDPLSVSMYAIPSRITNGDTAVMLNAPLRPPPVRGRLDQADFLGVEPALALPQLSVGRVNGTPALAQNSFNTLYADAVEALREYGNGAIDFPEFSRKMNLVSTRADGEAFMANLLMRFSSAPVPANLALIEILESLAAFADLPYSEMVRYRY